MSIETLHTIDKSKELNPYVSQLATRLMKTAVDAEMPMDSTGWQLITEVLSYAASAEQRMAEQKDRIAFLEQLSVTDELTGIPNRRGLKRAMGRILSNAARHNDGGVLAFIDLDEFKEINDTHGHSAGDAVLRHVAQVLKEAIRPHDMVARISGDEFAIMLTRCHPEMGALRIKEIQHTINNQAVSFDGKSLPISCSVGMKTFTGACDPAKLIDDADKAMYFDKKQRKLT